MDSESESKLISLISEIISIDDSMDPINLESKIISLVTQIVSLVSSMDLDPQQKPESELISFITQIISLLQSIDLDSQPKPLLELISLISQECSLVKSTDLEPKSKSELLSLISQTMALKPEPELISLIHQVLSLIRSLNSMSEKLISLRPQLRVGLREDNLKEEEFYVIEEAPLSSNVNRPCLPSNWMKFRLTGEDAAHFLCQGCNGENHEEHENAPLEVKHPLHPKHSLQLVLFRESRRTRKCYCCDEDLIGVFYYCLACDYAMNIACVEKPLVLSIDHPKWHEHTLAMFPRQDLLTCNICAMADSNSPIYMCPPCGFVVHKRCTSLPRVIRISRHLHRISFTPSFDQGDWSCGVCRKKIDSDYGAYSCIVDGCSYAAHSRCATQSNVWDGIELEELPSSKEDEVLEPFVRTYNGIIQHFTHECHQLSLDENTGRDYDENKECQACILPIYFGNFYSCMECDFILHEVCANLPRKIYHSIHPHPLTLVGGNDGAINIKDSCSACQLLCTGFFYQCFEDGCDFYKIHVQCATTSEPLFHESHMHPLFLTTKAGEVRICRACKGSGFSYKETFNCIECDFSLCFGCATLPHKVRYIDDKHMLTLSYGKENTSMTYWCEVCENELDPKERFYICDDYCCVTLHIECMLGVDFLIKPGSSLIYLDKKIDVLRNSCSSRPFCTSCCRRCEQKVFFQHLGSIACSLRCVKESQLV